MLCPKCASRMDAVTVDGVSLDQCSYCRGLWLDLGEVQALSSAQAARLDTGEEQPAFDRRGGAKCPRCSTAMISLRDPDQDHIRYEKCNVCQGAFFDAGELTDLKHRGIVDWFKRRRL